MGRLRASGLTLTLILTDSATGIAAIDDAYGVLKYMKRTQGVLLSWLHDVSIDPDNNIKKTSTDDILADVMTKALEKNKFQFFFAAFGSSPAWLRFACEFHSMVEHDLEQAIDR